MIADSHIIKYRTIYFKYLKNEEKGFYDNVFTFSYLY